MAEVKELTIARLGRQGDGIAETPAGDVYVPMTLPGEQVKAEVEQERGVLKSVVEASELRRKAECKHYASCGGCSLQHMQFDDYLSWKRGIVKDTLARAGVDVEPEAVVSVSDHSRRRAVMEIRRTKKTIQLGFHGRRSSDIVDIDDCLVIGQSIQKQLPNLKDLLRPLLSRKGIVRVAMTETISGLDLSIENVSKELTVEMRAEIADSARKYGVARIVVNGEPVVTLSPPVVVFDGIEVEIPPGCFLQATPDAEGAMRDIILKAVSGAKSVADLFCGVGTFSLPLAKGAEVTAIEYDRNALEQLKNAYHKAQGLKPVHTELRDLHREPLSAKELNKFDAVVFDPPRAGAKLQAEALAQSEVQTVVAVSCNPATMARDLKALLDGGYMLQHITPVDQFKYSAHIEAVAVLSRA